MLVYLRFEETSSALLWSAARWDTRPFHFKSSYQDLTRGGMGIREPKTRCSTRLNICIAKPDWIIFIVFVVIVY